MTSDRENIIADLQKDKRAAEELLFLVLHQLGKPFIVDLAAGREAIREDNAIDISIDEEKDVAILQVVPLGE